MRPTVTWSTSSSRPTPTSATTSTVVRCTTVCVFLREIVEAVSQVVGPQRLGVRFSPLFSGTDQDRVYIGLVEDDPHHTYLEAIKVLQAAGIAYVSIAEADWDNAPDLPDTFRQAVRDTFTGRIIYAGRYTAERGARGWSTRGWPT